MKNRRNKSMNESELLFKKPTGYQEPIPKSAIQAERQQYMDDFQTQFAETMLQNVENGEQLYSMLRGMSIRLLTGHMNDEEAFGTGHFDGTTNVALSTIISTEEGLNALVTVPAELIPVKIKGKKGIRWATDAEAEEEMERENLPIRKIKDHWFFLYPEISIEEDIQFIMTHFAYKIARASGSFQGETKQAGLSALSSIHSVPQFQQMAPGFMRPDPEKMSNQSETIPQTSFEKKDWNKH